MRELVRATPAPPSRHAWPADLARLCPAVERAWERPAAAARHARRGARAPRRGRRGGARLGGAASARCSWCWRTCTRPTPRRSASWPTSGAACATCRSWSLVTARPGAAQLDAALDGPARPGRRCSRRWCSGRWCRTPSPASPAALRQACPTTTSHAVVAVAAGNPLRGPRGGAGAGGRQRRERRPATRRCAGAWRGLDDSSRLLVDLTAVAGRPLEPGEAAELVGAEAAGRGARRRRGVGAAGGARRPAHRVRPRAAARRGRDGALAGAAGLGARAPRRRAGPATGVASRGDRPPPARRRPRRPRAGPARRGGGRARGAWARSTRQRASWSRRPRSPPTTGRPPRCCSTSRRCTPGAATTAPSRRVRPRARPPDRGGRPARAGHGLAAARALAADASSATRTSPASRSSAPGRRWPGSASPIRRPRRCSWSAAPGPRSRPAAPGGGRGRAGRPAACARP